MPFVPGCDHDIFISYSWADNRTGWVTNLTQALKDRVHELLGEEPNVWRDQQQLEAGHDFTKEIEARLTKTALLLVVVGPGYFKSGFCGKELAHFSRHGTTVGTRKTVIKTVKLPDEHGRHRTVLSEETGIAFYKGTTFLEAAEHYPGDGDFRHKVDLLAKSVCNVLRDIRNQRTPVYVSEPAPAEAESGWQRLRNELRSSGFNVLPDFRLYDHDQVEAVMPAMQPAVVSVHLMGTAWSKFAKLQLDLSRRFASSTVVWLPPGIEPEKQQQEFLRDLDGFKRLLILRTTEHWELAQIVTDEARPKAVAELASGPRKIYLLCDRTDADDEAEALKLCEAIREREKLEVVLPEKDRDAKVLDDHQQKWLAESDGVLVYWGKASDVWFLENYVDLRKAERARAAKPFLSRQIALAHANDPHAPAEWTLPYSGIESLEPFLAPLRRKRDA